MNGSKLLSLSLVAIIALGMTGCGDDSVDSNSEISTEETSSVNGVDGADGISGIDGVDATVSATKLSFASISTPLTDVEKATINASTSVTNEANGVTSDIGFVKLMATNDTNNGETFGLVKDSSSATINFADGSPYICNGTNDGVGSGLDYTSFLNVNSKLFMVSQFECQIGAMYIAELEQDTTTGVMNVKANSLKHIDQSSEFGGFVHCAGMATPWNSHLGSEEYEPDARAVESDSNATTLLTGNKYYDESAIFWTSAADRANTANTWDNLKTIGMASMSPYYYGWNPEVTIDVNDTAVYTKHYSMGRFSHELSYVMPDSKTVYMSDDGTNVGLFMFVADNAEDLSAGTLYGAKFTQTVADGVEGGSGDIDWINLGHATNADVRAAVVAKPAFSDLFNSETPNVDGTCPSVGFTAINTTAGNECLQLNTTTYSEVQISRLETRRYAALKGATTEFRKEEGITFDADHGRLYVAMSEVARGMEDNAKNGAAETKYEIGGNNDIKLKYNRCGAIYAMDIVPSASTAKDTDSVAINSKYVVNNMYAILTGAPTTYPVGHDYEGNSCSVDAISNPDNVTYLDGSNILVIGEDTSSHINNVVWAYDVESKLMSRMITTPEDAETTSPFWYKDLNGVGYMSVVAQHPIDDGSGSAENESFVGYYGPFLNLP